MRTISKYSAKKRSIKLHAVVFRGNLRYEKDLPQHFWDVPLWEVAPHVNNAENAFVHWADRIYENGKLIHSKVISLGNI